ncbi:MAG: hypothetical protein ACXV8Q_10990 [Methylobacter sp.]
MKTKKNNKPRTQLCRVLFLGLLCGYGLTPQPVSAAPFAYLTHFHSNAVWVIDTATTPNAVMKVINVGDIPLGVAVAPDGKRTYVATMGNFVSVIDTTTNTVVKTVAMDGTPHYMAVTPDGKRIYVTTYSGSVLVIDTATNTVMDTIPTDAWDVAVAPDGKRVYVTDYVEDIVSVIDTATNNIVDTVAVGGSGLAVAPDGRHVYVAHSAEGSVSVINTTTTPNTIAGNVNVGGTPLDVTVTPDGKYVYVANVGNYASVIDTTTNNVVKTVSMGNLGDSDSVAVTPDGKRVYLPHYGDGFVSVIDTATNTVVENVTVGQYPYDLAIGPLMLTKLSAFNINLLTIDQRHRSLFLLSNFALGKDSNGINPTNEAVTLKVGNVTMTIPPGSFHKNRLGQFNFVGEIDDRWIEILITSGSNRFGFQAAAYGVDFTGGVQNPVPVQLIIGNDSGNTSVKAIVQK